MILTFEFLDPIDGDHPNTLSMYGVHILRRARKILKNRSRVEIEEILAFINWITYQEDIRDFALNRMLQEIEAAENGQEELEYIGDDSTINFQINLYKKLHSETANTISNMEWHEVFATLAIALLAQAIDDEAYYGKWKDHNEWLHDWRILNNASTWIVEAIEAITIAEGLLIQKDSIKDSKAEISARNTKAAIQKHKKTNDAILELEKIHSSGKYKSMRHAVQVYCENYPEKVKHLAPYNRIRTLSEGLSAHLKGRRRSISDELQN